MSSDKNKQRLDQVVSDLKLAETRSQAENIIKMGQISVDGKIVTKPGLMVGDDTKIKKTTKQSYVSRAAYKLKSASKNFAFSFKDKVVLDVGSSTGGFTDFALQNGAKKIYAVDVGTKQMHPSIAKDERVELHEKTDIRDWLKTHKEPVNVIVVDVSFISLREILPHLLSAMNEQTALIAMLKPQFEAGPEAKHKGVIKNSKMRRDIIKSFEQWLTKYFVIENKSDSELTGEKGNIERFYLLRKVV